MSRNVIYDADKMSSTPNNTQCINQKMTMTDFTSQKYKGKLTEWIVFTFK